MKTGQQGLGVVGLTLRYQYRYDPETDRATYAWGLAAEEERKGVAAFARKHRIDNRLGSSAATSPKPLALSPCRTRSCYTEVTRVFPVGRFFKPSGRITNPSDKKQPKAGSIDRQGRVRPILQGSSPADDKEREDTIRELLKTK
jgi:hypothetical protein